MYTIGQVLYDKETACPVIYCGAGAGVTSAGFVISIYRGGSKVDRDIRDSDWDRYTHYIDEQGSVAYGTFIIAIGTHGRYFGLLDEAIFERPAIQALANAALCAIREVGRPAPVWNE